MIQQIINYLYRHPKANYRHFKRFGGYFNFKKIERERHKMMYHVSALAPVTNDTDGLPIYFLTGKRYLYQTIFCIKSLVKHAGELFKFHLVDDGSFDDEIHTLIAKKLPGATVITKAEIEINLSRALPVERYPFLHHKRKVYPHIKKLTDIHTIQTDQWKLVLDSDMLFWESPNEMIEWLKAPGGPLCMVDCVESYGYSTKLMEELCSAKLPEKLNVGAIGLNSSLIDWDKLESWSYILEKQEGASYYLEQALTAMLISGDKLLQLDKENYIVNPTKNEVENEVGKLHHYVDLSKEHYFKSAWKKLIE